MQEARPFRTRFEPMQVSRRSPANSPSVSQQPKASPTLVAAGSLRSAGGTRNTGSLGSTRGAGHARSSRSAGGARGAGHGRSCGQLRATFGANRLGRLGLRAALRARLVDFNRCWSEAHTQSFLASTLSRDRLTFPLKSIRYAKPTVNRRANPTRMRKRDKATSETYWNRREKHRRSFERKLY